MIYVTQGHQRSIGPEVFFKALNQIPKSEWKNITFVGTKDLIPNGFEDLKALTFDPSDLPDSTQSLDIALNHIDPNRDVLLTLPTSKDQLILNGERKAGYTEYLRAVCNNKNTAMTFKAPHDLVLLITDHIPLITVPQVITKDLILGKVENTLRGLKKYFELPDEIIFAGINPHVGENGIIGTEDHVIFEAAEVLKEKYPSINVRGPFSGDTLHFYEDDSLVQLKVYMYHDQGLPVFKARHGTLGLNVSLGLPFLRMSVDHGTAFDLYGKNKADERGALYLVKTGLEVNRKLNG